MNSPITVLSQNLTNFERPSSDNTSSKRAKAKERNRTTAQSAHATRRIGRRENIEERGDPRPSYSKTEPPFHILEIGPCAMRGAVHLRSNRVRPEQPVVLTTYVLAALVALPNLRSTSTLCEE
jgi:hypothetical protein